MEAAPSSEAIGQKAHAASKARGNQNEATKERLGVSSLQEVNAKNISPEKAEAVCPVCYEEFDDSDDDVTGANNNMAKGDELDLEQGCCQRGDDTNVEGNGMDRNTELGRSACLEDSKKKRRPVRKRVRVNGCSHEFCRACLAQQCKVSISRKEIPIPCPRSAENAWTNCSHSEHDCTFNSLLKDRTSEHFLGTDQVKTVLKNGTRKLKKEQEKCSSDSRNNHGCQEDGEVELKHTFSTGSLSSDDSVSTTSSVSSSPEYWEKYQRLLILKDNPTLISCTKCSELLPSQVESEGDSPLHEQDSDNSLLHDDVEHQVLLYPMVVCPRCSHQFCSKHGDIHRGMTCLEFAKSKQAMDMQQSEQAILEMTKPCSHQCGARISLVSGCDHVICTNCNRDMCYRCGTHEHLSGKVVRSCSGCRQGFVDHRHYCQYRFRLLFLLPLYVPVTIIYFAVAAVASVLTCCCGCCFCLGTRSWDCQQRKPKEAKSKTEHAFPEQQRKESCEKKNYKPPIAPGKGLWMVTQFLCYPIVELVRDCGCYPEHDDGDSGEASSQSTPHTPVR